MQPIKPPARAQFAKALDQQAVLALLELFDAFGPTPLLTLRENLKREIVTGVFGIANALLDIDLTALGLAAAPSGWIVVDHTAGGVIYSQSGDRSSWSATNIRLRSTAVGTAKVWVF